MISHHSNSLILITYVLYFNLNVFIHHAVPVGTNTTEIANQSSPIQSLPKLNSLNLTQVNKTINLNGLTNNTQLNITMPNVTFNATNEKSLVVKLILNSTTTKNETLIENRKQNVKSNSSNTTLEQKTKQIVGVSTKVENENLQKPTTTVVKKNQQTTVNELSSKEISKTDRPKDEIKNDKKQDKDKSKSEEVKEEDKSKNNEENIDKEQSEDKLQEPVEPLEDDAFESEKAAKNDAKEAVNNDSKKEKPNPSPSQDSQTDVFDDESSGPGFLTYFLVLSTVLILAYIAYHKKSKILGILLEGRPKRRYTRLSTN